MKHEVFMIYLQSSRSFLKNTSKKPLEFGVEIPSGPFLKNYCIHWVLCHFCVSSSSTSEKPFFNRRSARWGAMGGDFLLCQWDLWWIFSSRGPGRGPGPHFESWLLQKVYRLIRPMFDRFYLVIQTEQQQWGVYIYTLTAKRCHNMKHLDLKLPNDLQTWLIQMDQLSRPFCRQFSAIFKKEVEQGTGLKWNCTSFPTSATL